MRRDPVTAYIALGGNLGDAQATVAAAFEALARLPDTRLTARSRLYRTAPHEATGPDFINAVACVETRLTAPGLLQALQGLENDAGRQRPFPNAPRTLDLDILLYGQARIDSPALTVPHPRMRGRAFVLRPLADVAPDQVPDEDLRAVQAQPVCALESPMP
jgi:2-amino-4-hydroxy-6-hydroxymethyldihydropteridine diphosphokinase